MVLKVKQSLVMEVVVPPNTTLPLSSSRVGVNRKPSSQERTDSSWIDLSIEVKRKYVQEKKCNASILDRLQRMDDGSDCHSGKSRSDGHDSA